jgi:dephospho-CoA kinase
MIKVGLTGNMGSGKSTITEIFKVLGVPVFHADLEAKQLFQNNDVKEALKKSFGQPIFTENGVDKVKLAALVFNHKKALETLNSIIHPRVRQKLFNWLETQLDHPYVIQEAAILYESGFNRFFDKTILVSCPQNIAISRVMKRDGIDEEDVKKRIQNQWPEEKKIALADYIIQNDGSRLVIPEVLKIHDELRQ